MSEVRWIVVRRPVSGNARLALSMQHLITNASGQPEIVLELDGLVLSMTPPGTAVATTDSDSDSDDDDDEDEDADRSEHGR